MRLRETLKQRWVLWVWNHTPDCAEMSRLASRSLEQPPTVVMRLRMRLHHLICVWCRRYEQQLRLLHRAAPHSHDDVDLLTVRGMSPEARQRLLRRLREANGK